MVLPLLTFASLSRLFADSGAATRHLDRGESLVHQGEPGDCLYFVKRGRFRAVLNRGEEDQRVVCEFGRDETIGEVALLGTDTHHATVIAIRESEVLVIPTDLVHRLMDTHPREMMQLFRFLPTRMKDAYDSKPRLRLPKTIAIVSANSETPVDSYCQWMADILSRSHGSQTLISSRSLPRQVYSPSSSSWNTHSVRKLTNWLNNREAQEDTLLLQTDDTLTPWTMSCIRQADLILVVGQSGTDPTPGPIESELAKLCDPLVQPVVDLVLLQGLKPYHQTREWLQPRSVRRHYHVRLNENEDRERCRRFLSGYDVTLVLGGGGARGFAHIGFMRACQELGVPIDRVGGTSMGALVAAAMASGWGWQDIRERIREAFLKNGSLQKRAIPFIAVDSGKRYFSILQQLFGDTQIEDLPLNFFCVSTNLTRAQVKVHREGSLATWVGVSASIPGIAPPYADQGDLLADGGLLNNFPADIARADSPGRVLGVDVSHDVDLKVSPDHIGHPDSLDIARSWISAKWNGNAKPFPSIFSLLQRTTMISSISRQEMLQTLTDAYVKLPVGGYKMFEWEHLDELVEIGYQSSLDQLTKLKQRLI